MSEAAAVTERPILFSAPMVKALLAGTKTQTRRKIKDRDVVTLDDGSVHIRFHGARMAFPAGGSDCNEIARSDSPYGAVGDRLWVRESWQCPEFESWKICDLPKTAHVAYAADYDEGDPGNRKWRPSIHTPRWASRITLEITDVRVQRLVEISEEDARAEGVADGGCESCGNPEPCRCSNPRPNARDAFANLWFSINGEESWNANPWVWAVSFRRIATTH